MMTPKEWANAPHGITPLGTDTFWVDAKGRLRIEPKISYGNNNGKPRVVVRVKANANGARGVVGVPYWTSRVYPNIVIPPLTADRRELLRNMAMINAMEIGAEYRLRSKKL